MIKYHYDNKIQKVSVYKSYTGFITNLHVLEYKAESLLLIVVLRFFVFLEIISQIKLKKGGKAYGSYKCRAFNQII